MIKERVLPADVFTVVNKTYLNDKDKDFLIMLYQPIIGSLSISLYFSLWSYLDKAEIISNEWTHHHLVTNLRMKLENIVDARERLEAVGLIKSYVKKGNINNFVYEIYSPLNANEFLNNPVLSMALYSNVGEAEFKKIIGYFKLPKISLSEYEDISCKFNEVFESSDIDNYEHMLIDLRQIKKNSLEVISDVDIDSVLSLVPDEMLNIRSVNNGVKDFLHRIVFIYGLSSEELLELIKNSLSDRRTIDKSSLQSNARKLYRFEHQGNLPSLINKTQPEFLRKKESGTTKKAKLIYQFETTTPYDFICSKHNGGRPTKQEIEILEYLLIDMKFNPGVVNVMLDYILKESDNKLIRSFVEMVAGLFSRTKVDTVEDAMKLAEKEHKNRVNYNSKKVSNSKKTEVKPEWFDKSIEVSEVSLEKQKEMEELLSKVIK